MSEDERIYLVKEPSEFTQVASLLTTCGDLVAVTEELSPPLVEGGYRHGLFPWVQQDGYFLWFSPDPRYVLLPSEMTISHSLRRRLHQAARGIYAGARCTIELDTHTSEVIEQCANVPREGQQDTWITEEYKNTYGHLSRSGIVHSVALYSDGELIGGLWGTSYGKAFVGESMFHLKPDASKITLACLCQLCLHLGIELIDCQAQTDHLCSLGAKPVQRQTFTHTIERLTQQPRPNWEQFRGDISNFLVQ